MKDPRENDSSPPPFIFFPLQKSYIDKRILIVDKNSEMEFAYS